MWNQHLACCSEVTFVFLLQIIWLLYYFFYLALFFTTGFSALYSFWILPRNRFAPGVLGVVYYLVYIISKIQTEEWSPKRTVSLVRFEGTTCAVGISNEWNERGKATLVKGNTRNSKIFLRKLQVDVLMLCFTTLSWILIPLIFRGSFSFVSVKSLML